MGVIFLLFLIISIALTMIYRIRLVKYIAGERYSLNIRGVEDRPLILRPIRVLTLGAIFGGSLMSWLLLDLRYDNLFLSIKIGLLFILTLGLFSGLLVNLPSSGLLGFYSRLMWFLGALSTKFPLFFGLNFRGQI